MFSFAETLDLDTESFFRKLADYGIFWEMNVNCDSIHGYREHSYVSKFINSKEQQEIVRSSGIELSVGFDGHRVEEYKPDRISKMCDFLEKNHFRTVKLKLDF